MPYPGQPAGKTGHSDILSNPEIQTFLGTCEDLPRPQKEDVIQAIGSHGKMADYKDHLPRWVKAIDGSEYESPVDGRFPSRCIGYIKISSVLLDMQAYTLVKETPSRYIDPMAVARLEKDTSTISMALPGAYVKPKGSLSVSDGFRRTILQYFQSANTRLQGDTLYDTLVDLIRLLGRTEVSSGEEHVVFALCPNPDCPQQKKSPFRIPVKDGYGDCPFCNRPVYVTDSLRIHEAFVESGSNVQALTRLMRAVEHLLMAHYIRAMRKFNLAQLSEMCFVLDGPLALFGEPAHFHRSILKLLEQVRQEMALNHLPEPVVMGLTKTGRLQEHLVQIGDLLGPGTVFPIPDSYRYEFLEPAKAGSSVNFGDDTYYGQDFYIKTEKGRCFTLCLAYPFADKTGDFKTLKTLPANYATLGRALEVMRTLESELYQASMIPIVLAHRHASISLTPGGKVLDIASINAFKNR